MAKIQFLTILLTAACFLGGVVSVTDQEFEALSASVAQQGRMFDKQFLINQQLRDQNKALTKENSRQDVLIKHLLDQVQGLLEREASFKNEPICLKCRDIMMQNATIEERVSLLEIQVADIEGEITDLDQDVNFLFDEQIIQDERLFSLEEEAEEISDQLIVIDDDLESLQASTLTLDFRVTALEENGGSDGNSSVAELEVRVETLERTAADHETRIFMTESDINDFEDSVAELEIRLTASEENIQGLQMTDVELDERVTFLAENIGGSGQNDTTAFHSVLTSTPTIPSGSAILFDEILVNEGDGYDSTTGTFTVPSGGDGLYYFSVYLRVLGDESAAFDIEVNGEVVCEALSDLTESSSSDSEITSCSGVANVVEGDMVQVVYRSGTNTTPVIGSSNYYTGFNGFRI